MRKTAYRMWLLGTVTGTCSLCITPHALAQSAPAATTAPPANGGLETITVTARKKSENLQKVPLSITAITKATLAQSHVQNLQDIALLTPGINYVDNGSEVGTSITIRGITDLTFGANIPDVATFLDGVYLREPAAIEIAGAGLARVEVIKSPVSALYGRDAYTGVINYVPERGSATPHGSLDYTVGNYGKEQLVGNISGPLFEDKVFGKLFGQFDNFDGTYHDKLSGADAGGDIKKDIGGLLDFKWNSILSTNFDLYYGYDYFNASSVAALTPNCGLSPATGGGLFCGRIPSVTNVNIGSVPQSGNPGNERRTFFGSVHNSANFDWGRFDSLTGATKISEDAFQIFDASSLGRPYLLANSATPGVPNGKTILEHEFYGGSSSTSNFSEELRFTSPQDQRMRYGLGGFYYRENRSTTTGASLTNQNVPAGEALYSPFGAFGIPLTLFESPYGALSKNLNSAAQLTDEAAGFGNLEFDILPNLTVSGEYRYTDILQQFVTDSNEFEPGVYQPLGPHVSRTNQYFNDNDAIRWQPIPNATLYFAFANGTKPGGFNGSATVLADEGFGPETDVSFEGGAKTSWLDNRLRLNVAAYHIETMNTQAYGPSSDPKNPATLIKNFGSSSNTGFEVDTSVKPTVDTTLTFGLDYNDPTFSAGSQDLSDAGYCALIASCKPTLITIGSGGGAHQIIPIGGNDVPFSPKLTLSVTAEYNYEFLDVYHGYIRGNYSLRSSEYTSPANLTSIGGSSNLDFYAGITRGPYSLGAYVKNVTNNRTPVNFNYDVQLEFFQNVPTVVLPPGRNFAFTLSYNFGAPPAPLPEPPPAVASSPPVPDVAPARTYLVFFDWDRADLTARAQQIVASAAAASTHVQTTRIEVDGHTDLSGAAAYNQKLSVRRAQTVETELVRDGVSKSDISIYGFGESNPLVPTAKGVREPQNRRVEIILK